MKRRLPTIAPLRAACSAFVIVWSILFAPLGAQQASKVPSPSATIDDSHLTPVDRAMALRLSADFENAPFSKVIEHFRKAAKVDIDLDPKRLEESGIAIDFPVTLQLENQPFRLILERLLRQVEVTYYETSDSIVISTGSNCGYHEVRIYNVDKMLTAIEEQGHARPTLGELSLLVQQSVAPTSWDELGGSASTSNFGGRLVVDADQQLHRELEAFLQKLAKSYGLGPDAIRVTK